MRLPVLFVLGALSCGRAPPSSDFTLRIGVIGGLGEIRPEAHSGGAALATDLIYEPILRPVPGGWESRFLRRWERTGPRTWRMEFRPEARFSDGTAVTVGDIAEAARRRGLRVLEIAANELIVETASAGPIEPQVALGGVARQQGGLHLGTGPFAVASQEPGRLVLRRVRPAPGRIQRVEIIPCASGREALVRLLRGELGAVPSLDPALIELLDGIPGLRIVRGSGPHAVAVLFNPRLPAVERRALARALPADEIAAAIRREPYGGAARQPRVAPPPGRPLLIGYPRSIAFRRAALALRQGLGDRGGAVQPISAGELARVSRTCDLVVTNLLVQPPGIESNYLRSGAEWNFTGYANPRYDAALAAGDEEGVAAALADEPAYVQIARRERVGVVDARLASARFGEWGILETLPDWEVSP